jgi:hypothetical protein
MVEITKSTRTLFNDYKAFKQDLTNIFGDTNSIYKAAIVL